MQSKNKSFNAKILVIIKMRGKFKLLTFQTFAQLSCRNWLNASLILKDLIVIILTLFMRQQRSHYFHQRKRYLLKRRSSICRNRHLCNSLWNSTLRSWPLFFKPKKKSKAKLSAAQSKAFYKRRKVTPWWILWDHQI